ncbi:MAG: outer membrane beta-barrel domain-containing protein [Smithellaceae bacterium]|nr:outer membrane beta-barrel domain-containing protein [Smithellaceae bacterium]
MKSMYRAVMILAVFVLLLPLSARAEIRAGSFEVNPYVGYNFFEHQQNLNSAPVIGARLGYNITKYFGIEVGGQFLRTNVNDKAKMDNTEGQFGYPMDREDLYFYHINAIVHILPDSKFTPFIVAGFGGAHYSPTISTRDMAAFNVGVGAKFSLTENIALRVDVQDYIVTEIMQETYHNIGVTAGIAFSFGGSKPAPVLKREPVAEPAPAPAPAPVVEEKVVIVVASEPKLEEKVVVAAAEPKIIILAFEDIHFDFDKSTLKPEAQIILKRNIQILKDNPKAKVRIAGYTSASGTEEYNQKLSERRAKAVQVFLINEGVITPDRLSTIGYGETHPAMYEAAPKELYSKAAMANMRVLFEIIVR